MIYDVTTFNGEHDLFEIRYNILKDKVDEFIVLEFDKSFSGRPKESTFKYLFPKVAYHFVTEDVYSKYIDLALISPNTVGAYHWKREFCQKESIKDYLTHLKDDDTVFIGDVDEIWSEKALELKGICGSMKLKLDVYAYYLNNRSNEEFYGTILTTPKFIKDKILNHLRSNYGKATPNAVSSCAFSEICGWHFTSMGGLENVKKKLSDSYTEETYWNKDVQNNLESCFGEKDFLGRGFNYSIDESWWPQYLKDNRDKYLDLLYPQP